MKRRGFLFGIVAGLALGTPALAEGVVDSIVRQLKRLGFRDIDQNRTLLGRVRITAQRKDGQREIIVNPNTGEILRDLWTPVAGAAGGVAIIDDRGGKSGHGSGHDDDDDDEDDEDDDNSGSGSGNSGSGNSGSGNSGSGNSGGGSGGD